MIALLSGVAAFLGAALLFAAQPLLAKALLPRVGGSPAAWNGVQAFFMGALLLGYAWAHLVVSRAGARRGPLLHLGLLALPLALLATRGILPAPDSAPPGAGSPLPWALLVLAGGVGPAAVALATTAPLVQGWLAARAPQRDPTPLYAASNAGSLLALLAYPVLIEPRVALAAQAGAWSAGYAVWAVLLAGLALAARGAPPAPLAGSVELPTGARASGRDRWRWVALAAVPAALSLAVTQFLTTDLAPVPLLWVVPLAVYLLSWVLAYARRLRVPAPLAARWLPLCLVAVAVAVITGADEPLPVVIGLHLAGLFAVGLACHTRLAAERPAPRELTAYYLLMATGGALGGASVAFLAPLVFPGLAEYPLALCAAALLLPGPEGPAGAPARGRALALDLAAPVLVAACYLGLGLLGLPRGGLVLGVSLVYLLYGLGRRPRRLAAALLALFVSAWARPPVSAEQVRAHGETLAQERSWYGVHLLCRAEGAHASVTALLHGSTVHGLERSDAPGEPLAYYHRQGPLGELLGSLPGDPRLDRVGAIGLGAGSIAAYAPAGARWTFFELDPVVARLAEGSFSFLSRARARGAAVEVVLGDGRLSLARETRPGELGLLVLDAFSSDSVPVHLLTREALELYLSRLRPDGLLLCHVSSRFLDLVPVLSAHAAGLGLTGRHWLDADHAPGEALQSGLEPSHWVVLARRPAALPAVCAARRHWAPLSAPRADAAWRDDFSSLWAVLGK